MTALLRAVHAEWTKLRTDTGHGWLLLAFVAVTTGLSAAVSATVPCDAARCGQDQVKLALTGVTLGQTVVAIAAVLVIGNEYGSGLIHLTLSAVPRRLTALAAKATILTAGTLTAGTAAVLLSVLCARHLLPTTGFTPAHGYPPLSLTDTPTLRAAAGSVLYLTLIALLALGVATAVRDTAAAIGTVLALLYLFPLLTYVVSDPHLQRHLRQWGPMPAGLAIQSTTNLHALPIGPWPGLAVLTLWSTAALLVGGLLLARRDA